MLKESAEFGFFLLQKVVQTGPPSESLKPYPTIPKGIESVWCDSCNIGEKQSIFCLRLFTTGFGRFHLTHVRSLTIALYMGFPPSI